MCGAGKTEITFEIISYALKNRKTVGFAIPRKDVVIELSKRLQDVFKGAKVIAVYGGNTNDLEGDIIVLTTHQIYRYINFFDLLIMDEIDAFPYKGNDTLHEFVKRSISGNYLLMSATPSKELIESFDSNSVFKLQKRFHNHPIPVPQIVELPSFLFIFFLLKKIKQYKKEGKQLLIFVPTIDNGELLYFKLRYLVKKIELVHSQRKNRNEIINDFRNKKYDVLVTTSVLERGITIPNLQVIIFNADNNIFNSAALIQISGRVGRKKDYPDGEVIFLCKVKNHEMEDAIKITKENNSVL